MSETVTLTIGGVDYRAGPMVIWSLQRCWPSITSLSVVQPNPDMFERTKTYADIISSALMVQHPEMTLEAVLKRLSWDEAMVLPTKIAELLHFKPSEATDVSPGEATAVNPSTGTGQGSLQPLQPTE